MFRKIFTAFCWIVVFEAVSAGIGYATHGGLSTWYMQLQKPELNPPSYVFPIVWSSLYALIALAGWYVWTGRKEKNLDAAIFIFAAYMVFNWSWSFIFFELKLLAVSFVWIVMINTLAFCFIVFTFTRAKPAAFLMFPALCWTLFAGYLSYQIWQLN